MKRTLQTVSFFIWLTAFSFSAGRAYGDVGCGASASFPESKSSISKTATASIDAKNTASEADKSTATVPVLPVALDALPVAADIIPAENNIPVPAPEYSPVPQNDEAGLNSVIFFPNPVKDILTVRFPKKGSYTVLIYNIIGDKVMDKSVVDEAELKLDLAEMQNGMFFLSYEFDGKVVTKRFTKSN
jgi:hypothetical protein